MTQNKPEGEQLKSKEEVAEELWDEYCLYVHDDIDCINDFVGSDVMKRADFMKAVEKLPAAQFKESSPPSTEEPWEYKTLAHNICCEISTNYRTKDFTAEDKTELEIYMEFEEASLECCKGIMRDENVFYAGNPFTDEQRSELRLQWLKDLGLWPIKKTKYNDTK